MAYVPPLYDAVNFTLRPIVIPLPGIVNFDLTGEGADVGIYLEVTHLHIYSDSVYILEGTFITSYTSIVNVVAEVSSFVGLSNIESEPTLLGVYSDNSVIRILPDIISEPTTINVLSADNTMKGGTESDLPSGISNMGGTVIPWGGSTGSDEFQLLRWDAATDLDKININPLYGFNVTDDEILDAWIKLNPYDSTLDFRIDELLTRDALIRSNWISMFWMDKLVEDKRESFAAEFTVSFDVPYQEPGPQDRYGSIGWDGFDNQHIFFHVTWNEPGAWDNDKLVPWGPISYFAFCDLKYFPPPGWETNFNIPEQEQDPPDTSFTIVYAVIGTNTDPRCPWIHGTTGPRDPYLGYPPKVPIIHFPQEKESYYMYNTVLVKRLPDNAPIEITAVSITYDKQSWLWQFNITIGKDKSRYLDMIKPNPGNLNLYTDIEISINNWKFTCRVESYSESRVFAKDSWTVIGRSPSMELGSPQNQKTSHVYDRLGSSATAGAQIIDDILLGTMLGINNTGWTVDWTPYLDYYTGFNPFDASDWGIQPGTFSWSNLTQIEAVRTLTDSIGAFLMTVPDCATDKTLVARSLRDIPPWHWKDSSAYKPTLYHPINESYCVEFGRAYESLPVYTGVFVMGQESTTPQHTNPSSGIVVVETFRDGFGAGSRIYAPDYSNQWLQTYRAAGEQGRVILSDTGEWLRHGLRLFSIANKQDLAPVITGLVFPGEYIKMNEGGAYWFGHVSSVQINASLVNGAAPYVSQSIEVDQYIGD